MKIAQEPVSLETPIGEEEDSHLGDFIEDKEAPAPAEEASFLMLKEQLEGVLDTLTPREEKVLRLRFGLDDGAPEHSKRSVKSLALRGNRSDRSKPKLCGNSAIPAAARS